jgi:hypothetical protein
MVRIAVLALVASCWRASPRPPVANLHVPPVVTSCDATGGTVFRSEHRVDDGDHSLTVLYAGGAWRTRGERGGIGERRYGCVSAARMREIRAKLGDGSWAKDAMYRACRSRGDRTIVIDDRVVFRGNHCIELAFASQLVLSEVGRLIVTP